MPPVEPTIAAAWIAGASGLFGAVVGVTGAVLGAMFSRSAARDSTVQTIEADKASRVWEKKSDAYTDALASILYRMRVRDSQWLRITTDTEPAQPRAPVDWRLVEARLFAYASDGVLKALNQAKDADGEFDAAFHGLRACAGRRGTPARHRSTGRPAHRQPAGGSQGSIPYSQDDGSHAHDHHPGGVATRPGPRGAWTMSPGTETAPGEPIEGVAERALMPQSGRGVGGSQAIAGL
jgi:hypothetical protein